MQIPQCESYRIIQDSKQTSCCPAISSFKSKGWLHSIFATWMDETMTGRTLTGNHATVTTQVHAIKPNNLTMDVNNPAASASAAKSPGQKAEMMRVAAQHAGKLWCKQRRKRWRTGNLAASAGAGEATKRLAGEATKRLAAVLAPAHVLEQASTAKAQALAADLRTAARPLPPKQREMAVGTVTCGASVRAANGLLEVMLLKWLSRTSPC